MKKKPIIYLSLCRHIYPPLKKKKGTIYLMAQGTLEKVCFFAYPTIYKKIVNK